MGVLLLVGKTLWTGCDLYQRAKYCEELLTNCDFVFIERAGGFSGHSKCILCWGKLKCNTYCARKEEIVNVLFMTAIETI
jgi:hypothetical protein